MVRGTARNAALIIMAVAIPLLVSGCNGSAQTSAAPTATATVQPTHVAAATPFVYPSATVAPTYAVPSGTPIPATALAAKVNGQPIYLSEYEHQRDNYMRTLAKNRIDPGSPQGKQAMAQASPKILELLISRRLVLDYAKLHHLIATSAEQQQAIKQAGGQSALQAQLAQAQETMQEFLDNLTLTKTELAIVNSRQYAGTEYHVRQILLSTEATAKLVYQKLKAHGDFAALAETYSQDPNTKSSGGELGFLTRDGLGPILGPAASKLPINTFSQPIHSSLGYHIIEVLSVEKHVPLTGNALGRAKLEYWQTWYGAYRKAAKVQIFVKSQ